MEKYGFVYIWFDRKNKRYYVGSHWGTEDDGYICSSRMMRQAYNRRPEDFRRRIVKKIYTNRKDLLIEEERWLSMIDPDKTTPKNTTVKSRQTVRYYNIKLGNQNHWWSDTDSRLTVGEKISAAKKGKKTGQRDPSVGQAISIAKKESFAKLEAEKGYKFSPEHIKNMSKAQVGKKHTEEWKKQQSDRVKQQWSTGERVAKAKITEDHKKKISEALKGIKREDVSNYRAAHSKRYLITFISGDVLEVHGLKKYAAENNIPYITLSKAYVTCQSVLKYGIQSIAKIV